MFNNSVIRVFIVPPSFLAYVIVRYRHNLTIKLLPKQEGAGFPTLLSYILLILFALQRRQPSHQLFSSHLLLRFGYRKHLRFLRLLGTSPMNLRPNHQKLIQVLLLMRLFQVLQR